MNAARPRLTRSVEDYLKAVYSLTEREESASTSALAEALDVQPASVTGMVKRLAAYGYLEHARYHGVRLTETGSSEALRIIERSDCVTLNEVALGLAVQIRSVPDEDPDRLRYLGTLGLVPGARITVQERAPLDGPTTVSVESRGDTEVIDSDLADGIFLIPAPGR